MNWDQLKKNVGWRARLVPAACFLDEQGRALPPVDDDWIIESVGGDDLRISNSRTHHIGTLGKDHVYRFTTDPGRLKGGIRYGFLTLNVQIFAQGNKLWVRPNARPGDPVRPEAREVLEKWVDPRYPFDSGLQARLEAAGFRVAWCSDWKLSRKIDLEGWEVVVEPDAHGQLTKFRLRDRPANQTLISRRT